MKRRLSKIAALICRAPNPLRLRIALASYIRKVEARAVLECVYKKYATFTMIRQGTYLHNLELIDAHRTVLGSVVECGVWRGGMIAGIAELLGSDRQYCLFDSFEGLPPAQVIDGPAAQAWQANTSDPDYYDNCTAPRKFAEAAMKLAGATSVEFHAGWFTDTLPLFRPTDSIAILRLDADWYDSTMTCLEWLFPHMAPGGLIILDDYLTWDGCSRAVHDFLSRQKSVARVRQWRDDVIYLTIPAREPR